MTTTKRVVQVVVSVICLILGVTLWEGICAENHPGSIFRPTKIIDAFIRLIDPIFNWLGTQWARITDFYYFFKEYIWYFIRKYLGVHLAAILNKLWELTITPLQSFFKGYQSYFDLSGYTPLQYGIASSLVLLILGIFLINKYYANSRIVLKIKGWLHDLNTELQQPQANSGFRTGTRRNIRSDD